MGHDGSFLFFRRWIKEYGQQTLPPQSRPRDPTGIHGGLQPRLRSNGVLKKSCQIFPRVFTSAMATTVYTLQLKRKQSTIVLSRAKHSKPDKLCAGRGVHATTRIMYTRRTTRLPGITYGGDPILYYPPTSIVQSQRSLPYCYNVVPSTTALSSWTDRRWTEQNLYFVVIITIKRFWFFFFFFTLTILD